MNSFSFDLLATKGRSRAGVMHTPHGDVNTPIFMPVGTQASVKALDSRDIDSTGAQIILANTYHLYLRPGEKTVADLGGIQKMMNWNKPMLTDSGGFQVFSLGGKISDEGVEFTSHLDGSKHFFTPEKSIQIQQKIGADIIMAFDECTPDDADEKYAREALERTHRWSLQSKEEWERVDRVSVAGNYQALFGIVQGGRIESLRKESAQFIASAGFDGVAVGGETIGYNMGGTATVMNWIEDILPKDRPRYAMGLGSNPQDIIDAVALGFDMFDCVAPTRLARNGALYNGKLKIENGKLAMESEFEKNRLRISNREFATDQSPIQVGCDCYTCTSGYTRGYLHHLFHTKELSYYRLASIHNVRFMIRLCEEIREDLLSS
ncbi:MAG TPA: tRNA guanosine(34) transglycosylase Tgt [Patescibacteria group bacterium]|nr:tRNA guanosine(34) transglycosylase Tgt [Patescibacteria group bacterium]